MKKAIWIIAICEVVRALQNMAQLMMVHHDIGARGNAYADEGFVEKIYIPPPESYKERNR